MLPEGCSEGVAVLRLAVAGRSGILSSLCVGSGASVSMPFALSGTPQQPNKASKPPFFFLWELTAGEFGSEWPGVAVGPVAAPKRLLDALPLWCGRNILPLDSLERPPMLSLDSPAVAPLNPVAVGEG